MPGLPDVEAPCRSRLLHTFLGRSREDRGGNRYLPAGKPEGCEREGNYGCKSSGPEEMAYTARTLSREWQRKQDEKRNEETSS
jgi:hypothetical protein